MALGNTAVSQLVNNLSHPNYVGYLMFLSNTIVIIKSNGIWKTGSSRVCAKNKHLQTTFEFFCFFQNGRSLLAKSKCLNGIFE